MIALGWSPWEWILPSDPNTVLPEDAPPAVKDTYAQTAALWDRLEKEVMFSTTFQDHDSCRVDTLKLHNDEWLKIRERWKRNLPTDIGALNAHAARVNGTAKTCLNINPVEAIHATDAADAVHPQAQWVDHTLPGGTPDKPPPPPPPSSGISAGWYVAGGLVLIGVGAVLGVKHL